MEAIFFQKKIAWNLEGLQRVFETLAKSLTSGLDQTQFQMFLRQIGAPMALFRDSLLVQRVFHAFCETGSNLVFWVELKQVLTALSGTDLEQQLKVGFRMYNVDGPGISEATMRNLLPRVCKAIFRTTNKQLDRPFNSQQNLDEFVDKLYGRMRAQGAELLDFREYKNLAHANQTMCSLFTIGCSLPDGAEAVPATATAVSSAPSSGSSGATAAAGSRASADATVPARRLSNAEPVAKPPAAATTTTTTTPTKGTATGVGRGGGAAAATRGSSEAGRGRGAASTTTSTTTTTTTAAAAAGGASRGGKLAGAPSAGATGRGGSAVAPTATRRSGGAIPRPAVVEQHVIEEYEEYEEIEVEEVVPVRKIARPRSRNSTPINELTTSDEADDDHGELASKEAELQLLRAQNRRLTEQVTTLTMELHVRDEERANAKEAVSDHEERAQRMIARMKKYKELLHMQKAQLDEISEANQQLSNQNTKLQRLLKQARAKAQPDGEASSAQQLADYKEKSELEVNNYHRLLMWMLQLESSLPRLATSSVSGAEEANTATGAFAAMGSKSTDGVPATPGGVMRIGELQKQGDFVKSWKKRLFVLREDGQLLYFSEGDVPKPRGSIDVNRVSKITKAEQDTMLPFSIALTADGRDWFLNFESQSQMQDWISAFKAIKARREEPKPRPR